MKNFIKNISVTLLDKLNMLSLKFVSNSLRNATALATNHLGSSVGVTAASVPQTPSVSTLSNSNSSGSNQESHNQPLSGHARFLTTSSVLNLGAMSESRARVANVMEVPDLKLPLKPKKPRTPWLVFVQERKGEILSQKAKMNAAEMSSILAKEWRTTDKSKYQAEYDVNHEQYLKQIDNYENSLTQEHRDYLSKKKNLDRESKVLRELRKTKPPTLPRNPANFYCAERTLDPAVKEQLKSGKQGAALSSIARDYKSLSDQEKEKYIKMKEMDKARFSREFQLWYESIMAENGGHGAAVRKLAQKMRTRFETLGYI